MSNMLKLGCLPDGICPHQVRFGNVNAVLSTWNADLAEKVGQLETGLADVNEVLRWLGEENQSRADEIDALQSSPAVWENRRPIGFQKE